MGSSNQHSDLIRREDVIEALGEEPPVWFGANFEIAERNQWRCDKAAIEAVPSVEPERKKGKWILPYNEHYGETSACFYYFPRCSNCGGFSANDTDYCPNCGADMREGDAT